MNAVNFNKNQKKANDGTIFGLQPLKTTLMSTAILKEPLENLPISKELKQFMFTNGFANLEELINEGTQKLQRTKGFTIMCFESLLNILDQNNVMHLLSEGDE